MADRRRGAIAVVGQRVDHDGDARRPVPLVADLFELFAGQLPRAPLDRVLDPVGGHIDLTRLLDCQAQPKVAVNISAAFLGGDRDLATGACEGLAAFGVDDRLFVLDAGPLGVP